jgi:peptide/nickel transport system permease protein
VTLSQRDVKSSSAEIWKLHSEGFNTRVQDDEVEIGKPRGALRELRRRFGSQWLAVAATVILLLLAFVAIFQAQLAPFDPTRQDLRRVLMPPNSVNLFGTDDLGRDNLSRLIYGTRLSLLSAIQATGIAVALGLPLGIMAGYLGGTADRVVMFVNDAIMALPGLLLAIGIVGMLGPGLTNAMIAIGIVFAPRILRIVRASVMEVKEETYIEAARSIGMSRLRIVRRHVIRNIRAPLIVSVSLMLGRAMLNEASLSFLGLGAKYPQSSWGAMLGRAFPFIDRSPLMIVIPGIAIAVTVLCFNVVGDAMRDSLGRETRTGE